MSGLTVLVFDFPNGAFPNGAFPKGAFPNGAVADVAVLECCATPVIGTSARFDVTIPVGVVDGVAVIARLLISRRAPLPQPPGPA